MVEAQRALKRGACDGTDSHGPLDFDDGERAAWVGEPAVDLSPVNARVYTPDRCPPGTRPQLWRADDHVQIGIERLHHGVNDQIRPPSNALLVPIRNQAIVVSNPPIWGVAGGQARKKRVRESAWVNQVRHGIREPGTAQSALNIDSICRYRLGRSPPVGLTE